MLIAPERATTVPEFGFRPLCVTDLPLVHQWLNASPVLDWYTKKPVSLAEIEAKYRPRIAGTDAVCVSVATVDGNSVGLFQFYPTASFPEYQRAIHAQPGWYGIDFFVGAAGYRGRGYAPKLLAAFEPVVAARAPNYTALVAGPNPENAASIRSLLQAGFVPWLEIKVSSNERESIMVRDRAALEHTQARSIQGM